jgi:peptidoglycan/xylan/chitin deacetylase (PgdA/CDA1 family)
MDMEFHGRQLHFHSVLKAVAICLFFTMSCKPRQQRIFIADYPQAKKMAISFTFDDGCPSAFSKAAPLFNRFGYKATFFIIPGQVKTSDWPTWKKLSLQSFEIGNHSLSHSDLTKCDSVQLSKEICDSKISIEQNIGRSPISFAHPGHKTSLAIDRLIFKNHYFSRMSPDKFCEWRGWVSGTTIDIVKHDIKKFLKAGNWFVPAMHGIEDCWEPVSEALLNEVLNYVHEREDEIIVETFGNIALYKREKQQTIIQLKSSENRTRVSLRSNLDPTVFNYPLTLVMEGYPPLKNLLIKPLTGALIKVSQKDSEIIVITSPDSSFEIIE